MQQAFTRGRPRARQFLVPLFAAFALAACSGDARTSSNITVPPVATRSTGAAASVVISPASAAGTLGQSAQFAATAYDSRGQTISGTPVAWKSGDPTIVAISATGFATAVGVGATTITATINGVVGTAPASVSGDAIATIALTPGSASGNVGQSAQFSAALADAHGTAISGRPVVWASTDTTVVRVDPTGVATGVGNGSARVTATSAGITASAAVTVGGTQTTAPSTIADLAATPTSDTSVAVTFTAVSNGAGQPASYEVRYAAHPISWGSAISVATGTCKSPMQSPAVGATVTCSVNALSPATAYDVQAVAFRGTLGTNAVFGGLSNIGNATTAAQPSQVASVSVTPGTATGNVGDKGQFSAVALDAAGHTLSGRTITWSSSNTSVMTVDANGLATGVGGGSAYVIATVDGVAGRAQVTVNGPSVGDTTTTVGSVSVSPAATTLTVGATQQLTSVIKSLLGALLGSLTTTWSSSAPSVATVNGSGMVTAIGAGTATITGGSGGQSATSIITVVAAGSGSSSEPTPSASVIFQDDFQSYLTAADILAAYDHMNGETGIQLDLVGGVGGSSAMRIDWAQRLPSTGCTDDDHLVEQGFAPTQEIYAQYYVRYTAGFVFDWDGIGGCSGNAKKLFLMPGGSGSRLDLISENHHIVLYEDQVGYATGLQNVGTEFTPEMLGDGRWHRITIHARLSSSAGANNGVIEGWIDGVKQWSHPNPVSGTGYSYFQTPTVFNQGSPVAQTEWMDNVVVWKP